MCPFSTGNSFTINLLRNRQKDIETHNVCIFQKGAHLPLAYWKREREIERERERVGEIAEMAMRGI